MVLYSIVIVKNSAFFSMKIPQAN